jgi:hypothetical protein
MRKNMVSRLHPTTKNTVGKISFSIFFLVLITLVTPILLSVVYHLTFNLTTIKFEESLILAAYYSFLMYIGFPFLIPLGVLLGFTGLFRKPRKLAITGLTGNAFLHIVSLVYHYYYLASFHT